MDKRILIWAVLIVTLLSPTNEKAVRPKRDHVPPEGVSTFVRDAIESPPQNADTKSPYSASSGIGSRFLPLRNSVEMIPDVKEYTRRLPLRDAVEKRIEYKDQENSNKGEQGRDKYPGVSKDEFSIQKKYGLLQSYLSPAMVIPQRVIPFAIVPDYTYYSPYSYFSKLVTDINQLPEYRVDNRDQQLLMPVYSLHNTFVTNTLRQGEISSSGFSKKIVCYIESSAVYRTEPFSFSPNDLDPFACTHVVYVSATIDPKTFRVVPRDNEYDIVQGGYRSAIALKKKNPNLKLLIAVGEKNGNTESLFETMMENLNLRRDFIQSLAHFLYIYQFDGVDFHWQFPECKDENEQYNEKAHFGRLLEEMYHIFYPQGWLIAVSAPPSRYQLAGLNLDILAKTVEFVNVEAYDFQRYKDPVADHHAPFNSRPHDNGKDEFYNFDYAAHYWLHHGFPRSKLVMGIPLFGRSFTLSNSRESGAGARISGVGRKGEYTQTPGFLAYFEVCDIIKRRQIQKRTDVIGSPYIVDGDQWVGYDDSESIEKKALYIREMNLGGASLWTADLDDYKGLCGDKWPLLRTVSNLLRESDSPSIYGEIISKPFQKCGNEGVYSNIKNCAQYFECRNGVAYQKACSHDMLFNINTGSCDSIDPINCKPGQQIFFPNLRPSEVDTRLRASQDVKPKVVCYVTSWAFYRKADGKFVPENIDPELCTHVVYAFATLDPTKLAIKEFDSWADLDNSLYERIASIPGVTPLLGLGGWTDSAGDKYSRLVSDGSNRRKFVIGVVSFLRKYGFKGLHLDWNYPVCWQSNCKKGPASDKPNFTKLIQELKTEFDKQDPPLVLAATISGYKEVIDVAYDLPSLGSALEFMSVMSYDYHGSWERKTGHVSPLYGNADDTYPQYNTNFTMNYLVSKGAPRNKLLVGIPFYGQTYTISKRDGKYGEGVPVSAPGEPGEYTKQPGMLSYFEICSRIKNQRWTYKRNDGSGPYAYLKDQWVGFDDPESLKTKGRYIRSHGFGGAVAWTVDLDDFDNRCCQGSFPLLRSLNKGLGLIPDKGVTSDCTRLPAPSTPEPPKSTTGFDTSAESSTWDSHHDHDGHTSKKPTTITTKTTTKRSTTVWWELSTDESTSTEWWKPSTSKKTTTTSRTTTPWWVPSSSRPTRTTTKRPTPAVVRPDVDADGHKPEKCYPNQYKADPYNCNAYYRCIQGEYKKLVCAGGLHWNNNRRVCDWPASAKCKETTADRTTTRRTTTSKRPTTSWWEPSTQSTESSKKCETGQYYPHEHCDSFYVCVNGLLLTQKCGPGLYWNAEDSRCDWRYRAKCIEGAASETLDRYTKVPAVSATNIHSSCSPGSYSALKGSCEKYLYCLWGKYELFACASGLHWNPEKKVCDWPNNAKCNELPENTDTDNINEVNHEPPASRPTNKPSSNKPTRKPTTTSTTTRKPWEWKPESTTAGQWDWKPTKPTFTTTTAEPPAVPFEPLSNYFKIVCYFTNWAWYRQGVGKYIPEHINPELCTHIVYGFAVLDTERLVIKAHDSWADFDNYFYERVVEFKKAGKKVTLAIGGWNDSLGDKYSRLVNNPSARARFIQHVIEFLEKHNFDGLDLDWEYPKCWQVDCKKGPDSDKPAFAAFVKELKEAFRPKGLLLSAAVSPSKTVIDAGYDVPTVAKYLDWIAVMTYDFHGQWDKQTGHVAPLYLHPEDENVFFNANFSINYWISQGAPRRKIIMGMPLYGQSFQLEKTDNHALNAKAPGPGQAGEFTRAAGFLAYYEICNKIKKEGWTVVQDPKRRMGPYAYKGNQWVSFDDQEQIRLKSEYIRKMDLGGGMIWALDLDDFNNRCGEGRHPLLSTIRRVLAKPGTGKPQLPDLSKEPTELTQEVPKLPSTSTPLLTDPNSEYKVVCYFTNWAWYRPGVGKYVPGHVDPNLCTHIVYGFAILDADQMTIKIHDSWADIDNDFYGKLTAHRKNGIKVLIAIGGWNDSEDDKYSRLVNDPESRAKFITSAVQFIEEHNFDGLDLDWEFPKCWQGDCKLGPASDKQGFTEFVRELREAFTPKNFLLSSAVSPSSKIIDVAYDVPELSQYLDWIGVMNYDYHGQWDKVTGHVAPMYVSEDDTDITFNTNYSVNYWIEQGADRRKLVMGIPTYGQSFTLSDPSQNGMNAPSSGGGVAGEQTRVIGFLAYYEICHNVLTKGWNVVRDPEGKVGPYAYSGDQWVSFDDADMARYKSQYIKNMGLGGGMIWALDLDDFSNHCGCEEYPLLRTINRVLRDYPVPDPTCSLEANVVTTPPPNVDVTTPPPNVDVTTPASGGDSGDDGDDIVDDDETCDGSQLFKPHPTNCDQYYMCNLGRYEIQTCNSGLYWNVDHCDWPENSPCTSTNSVEGAKLSGNSIERKIDLSKGGHKVVCFFTNWASYRQEPGKYTPEDIDASLCTHIVYGFAVLDSESLTIKPHNSWTDIDNDFFRKVTALRAKGVKVSIALGGWNDSCGNKYSRLVSNAQSRARFIENVIQFLEKWNFDGLDLYWMYPKCWQVDCRKGPDTDKIGFAKLIEELSSEFKQRGLLLSAAVSPSKTVIDAAYDVPKLDKYLDWMTVMNYDFHGHWDNRTGHLAPLYQYPGDQYDYFNSNFSLNYWIEKGASPNKLIMGVPFYGQSFTLANPKNTGLNVMSVGPGKAGQFTKAGGFLAFYEICEMVNNEKDWKVTRDPVGRIGPYATKEYQWVSYDDISDIKRKSEYLKDMGLGGAMVWSLDLDDFKNRCGCGAYPLLKTVNNILRGFPLTKTHENCT